MAIDLIIGLLLVAFGVLIVVGAAMAVAEDFWTK